MIEYGGLKMPDLRPHFKHLHWRPMPHSYGVEVASDWTDKASDDPIFGLYKNCGLWTMEEAAILYNAVAAIKGDWLDIGCHTGWTTRHIAEATTGHVDAIDGMTDHFRFRQHENLAGVLDRVNLSALRSDQWFDRMTPEDKWDGVVIDGDHDRPWPLDDAKRAAAHLEDPGVIIFHDFAGAPVREAVTWLMDQGFNARVYWTPHMVALCWRGDYVPPVHQRAPDLPWLRMRMEMQDFDFRRCV